MTVNRNEPSKVLWGPRPQVNLSGGSMKERCAVLYDGLGKDAKVVAVGYEAEVQARTPETEQRLVVGFKLHLYDLKAKVPWRVNKTVQEVYEDFLQYVLENIIKPRWFPGGNFDPDDILWIFTTPAVANMTSQTALKRAAKTPLHQALKLQIDFKTVFQVNDVIVIMDCGSGTIDVGVYRLLELSASGKWKAQHLRQVGLVGAGEKVDEEFRKYLKSRMGREAFEEFVADFAAFQSFMRLWAEEVKPVWHSPTDSVSMQLPIRMATIMNKHGNWQQFLDGQDQEANLLIISGDDMETICRAVFNSVFYEYHNLAKDFKIRSLFTVGGTVYMKYLKNRLRREIKESRNFLDTLDRAFPDMYCVEGGALAAASLDAIVARCPPMGIGIVMYLSLPKPKNWQQPPVRQESDWTIDQDPDEYACPKNNRLIWKKCFIPITTVGDRVFVTHYYRMTRSITPQSEEHGVVYIWIATTTERIDKVAAFSDLDRGRLTEPKRYAVQMGPEVKQRKVVIKIEFRLGEVAFLAETEEGQQAEELQPL
ncbi:hypothetical protein HK097_011535 [Rhizophlyctis rosea]|uniref:Uncharacterized protein n=1 Tax=Rhizophlyctis rosea TaxID=64517 RepID=A0AAD5S675_9FUNG|nr:hypothetical protein HK097_011535 [Rhizophlyctis rosea]